jgi:hypothetical protein
VRAIVDRRNSYQVKSPRAIEYPQNEQVRKTFDVGEAGFELLQNLQNTFGVVFRAKALGDFLGRLIGTPYVTNGLR